MAEIIDSSDLQANLNSFKAKVGEYDVLDSKILICTDGFPVSLFIEDIVFKFGFYSDTEIKGTKAIIRRVNEKEVELQLTNYDTVDPIGSILPVKLGTAFERNLYFTYSVETLRKETGLRRITYNLLLGASL